MPPVDAIGTPARGSPAGYGRSCTSCSRAKCKCILRPEGGACERCYRLNKECHQGATARRRIGKKTTASRTAQLEEKLDDLVSILRASQQSSHQLPPSSTSSPNSPFPSRLDSLATAATSSSSQPRQENRNNNYIQTSYATPTLAPGFHAIAPSIDETYQLPEPTIEEAELYLAKFRTWLQGFPFMDIPSNLTAVELRKDRPFLWLCIMNLTTMSLPQHNLLQDKIREEFAAKAFVNHERSMDLLLGLTAFLGWATMNSGPGSKPFLVIYSQLALTVLYELGLTRAPQEEQLFTACFKIWAGKPPPPKQRTLEEQRVVISVWFLTSVITSFIGRMDTLRWTTHMDECLEVLDNNSEHPSDAVLVRLVRLQLVGDEAQRLLIRDALGENSPGQVPSYVYKKTMLDKVREVKESIGRKVAMNSTLLIFTIGVEALVHSIGNFSPSTPHTQQIEGMYSSLKAVRAWYDEYLNLRLEDVPGSPFAMYSQMSQMQVTLYRLTVAEVPGWDKDIVRNTANLLDLLEQTCERFDQLQTVYPIKSDANWESLFYKAAKIMRNIRASWEPVLSQHLTGMPTPDSQVMHNQQVVDTSLHDQSMLPDPNSIEFGDMTWMTDVFGPWEF